MDLIEKKIREDKELSNQENVIRKSLKLEDEMAYEVV